MKVFIDTNVLIDYLAKREPFCYDATLIFEMLNQRKIKGAMSALTIVNCAYVLRKAFPPKAVMDTVKWLCDELEITAIDKNTILHAAHKHTNDFEDSVQYFSATYFHPDVVITRDKKGFSSADIVVMTPAEFIAASR